MSETRCCDAPDLTAPRCAPNGDQYCVRCGTWVPSASSVPAAEPEGETPEELLRRYAVAIGLRILTPTEKQPDFRERYAAEEQAREKMLAALRSLTERAERAEAAMFQSATSSSQTSSSDAALGAALRAALASLPPHEWAEMAIYFNRVGADGWDAHGHEPGRVIHTDATRQLSALLRSSVHPKTQEEEK